MAIKRGGGGGDEEEVLLTEPPGEIVVDEVALLAHRVYGQSYQS